MTDIFDPRRRRFIETAKAGLVLAGGLLVPAPLAHADEEKSDEGKKGEGEEKVTPPEDLMREHGVLDRVLLIYEAALRKYAGGQDFDVAVVADSAKIVRDFIEDYHEKSEEEDVFPRFRKAGKLVDLVDILLAQHQAGRRVTDVILHSAPTSRQEDEDKLRTVAAIQGFIAMYRPHAAREDTDLFPKLKDLVSSNEYDAMAERFEQKEHRLFGEDGFEKMVDRVAGLERRIGVHDLAQFTPKS